MILVLIDKQFYMKLLTTLLTFLWISFGCAQNQTWSLEDCIQYAIQNNISIQQNALNIEVRDQNMKAAKGQFLPNVSASASHSLGFGDRFPFNNKTIQNTNLGVSATQTIFNGFQNTLAYKQAKLNIEVAQLELARIKDDVSLNVVNNYLNVLLAQENVKIAKAQVHFSTKQVKLLANQVKLGARAQADLLDVEATLANDEQRLINAENTLIVAQLSLTQLLQIPSGTIQIKPIDQLKSQTLLPKDSETIYKQALALRNEIKLAKKNVEVSEKSIEIAKSAYLPTVSATYSANTGIGFTPNFNDPSFLNQLNNQKNHSLGISIRIPIFNQNINKTNTEISKITKKQVDYTLSQEKLDLRQNIERSFTDVINAQKSLEASEKLLKAQQFSFDNAQKQLELGAINVFDLEQIRNRYINAKLTLNNNTFDFIFKTKILEFYGGQSLWEK